MITLEKIMQAKKLLDEQKRRPLVCFWPQWLIDWHVEKFGGVPNYVKSYNEIKRIK